MNFLNNNIILFIVFLSVAGCGDHTDQTLSPAKDAHWVTVQFKVPDGTMLQPMQVMYRSDICKDTSKNSSGESYDIKGINGFKQAFTKEKDGNTWKTQIAIEGGGSCQWMLNSIKISFHINNSNPLVHDRNNLSTNYILDFDKYGFSDGYGTGSAKESQGNFVINTDFFPMITTLSRSGNEYVELFGGNVDSNQWTRRFNVHHINKILIEPVVHMDKIVVLSSAKGKPSGLEITYPDGSIGPVHQTIPDYEKLLSMK